jgi:precorrin-6B methylase 1
MKTAHYTAIAAIAAISAAAVLMGATHHVLLLAICAILGLAAWAEKDNDNDIAEFKE